MSFKFCPDSARNGVSDALKIQSTVANADQRGRTTFSIQTPACSSNCLLIRLDDLNYHIVKSTSNGDTTYQIYSEEKLKDISTTRYDAWYAHRLQAQGVLLFGKSQFFGVSAIQAIEFSHINPVYDTRLGLLFRFRNPEKEKTRINVELFLAFNDWADANDKGKSAWQRKQIGVSLNVPFNQVFFQ